MKSLKIILFLLTISFASFGQAHSIRFILDEFNSVKSFVNRDTAIKALNIEAEILSSKEFMDTLKKRTFDCRNNPPTPCECVLKNEGCSPTYRISGEAVYEALMKDSVVHINLDVERASFKERYISKSYGMSCPCKPHTTTFFWWLRNGELPVSYNYAYHLAHEFTHISGYVHGDQPLDDDTAYSVGNIVNYLLKKRLGITNN
jgi:hypothetical protein